MARLKCLLIKDNTPFWQGRNLIFLTRYDRLKRRDEVLSPKLSKFRLSHIELLVVGA